MKCVCKTQMMPAPDYRMFYQGTYKVRNEIETKRNEISENETKSTKWKRNETKPTKAKRNRLI